MPPTRCPQVIGLLFGGQEEAIEANRRTLLTAIALAVFMVFSVMAIQYESFVNPLVIMIAIPMALVGVVASLLITGLPISAPVMLGLILLAGIVVNNGILLVEYIEIRRRGGEVDRVEAVLQGAPLRVRPIMMTVSTTAIGMLPLALNPAEGAELMSPLAVTVIGGLILSAALTLYVVPCLYLILTGAVDRLRERMVVGTEPPVRTEGWVSSPPADADSGCWIRILDPATHSCPRPHLGRLEFSIQHPAFEAIQHPASG